LRSCPSKTLMRRGRCVCNIFSLLLLPKRVIHDILAWRVRIPYQLTKGRMQYIKRPRVYQENSRRCQARAYYLCLTSLYI
jgi:hypothetical protein